MNTGVRTVLSGPQVEPLTSQRGYGLGWHQEEFIFPAPGVDLNGDGDPSDRVLQLFRIGPRNPLGPLAITPLLALHDRLAIDGSIRDAETALVRVSEPAEAGLDRNGDGDALDGVLSVVDLRQARVRNLGIAVVDAELGDPYVTFRVSEAEQGNTDLNADGDTSDIVGYAYDRRSGALTNIGMAASTISSSGELILLRIDESQQAAQDLNGDGDALDQVLFIRNMLDGSTVNLGLSGTPMQAVGPRLVFSVTARPSTTG